MTARPCDEALLFLANMEVVQHLKVLLRSVVEEEPRVSAHLI